MKKIMYLILSMIVIMSLVGCSASTSGEPKVASGPQVEKVEVTADKFMKLTSYGQHDQAYEYLHPDLQKKFSKAEYVADRSKNIGNSTSVTSFKVETATLIPSYSCAGITFNNVAEVPVMVTVGTGSARTIAYFAKAPDGTWRCLLKD